MPMCPAATHPPELPVCCATEGAPCRAQKPAPQLLNAPAPRSPPLGFSRSDGATSGATASLDSRAPGWRPMPGRSVAGVGLLARQPAEALTLQAWEIRGASISVSTLPLCHCALTLHASPQRKYADETACCQDNTNTNETPLRLSSFLFTSMLLPKLHMAKGL